MKKFLFVILMMLSFVLVNAQDSTNKIGLSDVYLKGGYSYHNGLVGTEVFFNRLSLGGGWMPHRITSTETKVNSVCLQLSVYFDGTQEKSPYGSIGVSTDGYNYQNEDHTYSTENAISIIGGYRWVNKNLDLKMGVGLAGSRGNNYFTGEIVMGVRLFHNKNF